MSKISIEADQLRYIDSVLSVCIKKAGTLGIHNDSKNGILTFFILTNELKLEYLNDVRLMFESDCKEDFTVGLEYDLFKKLIVKKGTVTFDFGETHISIKTSSGNHRFKSTVMSFVPFFKTYKSEYQLFTTDISTALSHVFEPDYDSKQAGNFANDILFNLVGKNVIVTTTNRNVLTRYNHIIQTVETTFIGERISIPANAMSFILNTLKDMNIFTLSIGEEDIQVWLSESKYTANLKYNVKLSATTFPNCDQFLLYGEDTFKINSGAFTSFVFDFVSAKNDNLQEVVSATINKDSQLEFSLVHRDHNSVASIPVELVKSSGASIYIDLVLLRKMIKNIPSGLILKVGLFQERCFIWTIDNTFQSVIMGIQPDAVNAMLKPPEQTGDVRVELHEVAEDEHSVDA